MNRTLAITTITLVAVVMGLSSVTPALGDSGICKGGFSIIPSTGHEDKDLNGNDFVCIKIIPTDPPREVVIDDIILPAARGCPPPCSAGD